MSDRPCNLVEYRRLCANAERRGRIVETRREAPMISDWPASVAVYVDGLRSVVYAHLATESECQAYGGEGCAC